MAFAIDIYGPHGRGEFIATLPCASTHLITHWEDLEEIRARSGVIDVNGDVLNLMPRSRHLLRENVPEPSWMSVSLRPPDA
jgi:hypothetical protein